MRLFLSSLNSGSGGVITPPVMGCTNPLATNYNPLATVDDGSCVFSSWELPANSVRLTGFTGQSNAGGNGSNASALAGEIDETEWLKIWRRFNFNFANLNISTGNNVPNIGNAHSIELGVSLLQEANFSYPLYLAKYHIGGTEILHHLAGGQVFQTFWYDVLRPAINFHLNAGQRVFVDFVYLQGEQDSEDYRKPFFNSRLDSLITQWRTLLGANLPISFIEIVNRSAGVNEINTIFQNKATADPLIKVIEASELATNDGIHYSYSSFKTIAQRYMDAMVGVVPLEITSVIPNRIDLVAPAAMTLTSLTNVGGTYTVVAQLNGGDAVTSNANLVCRLYNNTGFSIYHTTGKLGTDPNVTLSGGQVTITNITRYTFPSPFNFWIQAIDEAGNYSAMSNVLNFGSQP